MTKKKVIVPLKKERVVNIVGLGKTYKMIPDDGEVWGLCHVYKKLKGFRKIDKLFFMDPWSEMMVGDNQVTPVDYKMVNFLRDNPKVELISKFDEPIYADPTQKEKIGHMKAFPLDEALNLMPGAYFTSTIAYTIVYAIMQEQMGFPKVDRIRLYGFELWAGSDMSEYTCQAPCVEFWIGFAFARGIFVEIPFQTMFTSHNTQNYYGYLNFELQKLKR